VQCVRYDLSVRASNGHVVQFKYGSDGLDPVMMAQVPARTLAPAC
jgi:hypothetical protein